MNTLGQKPSLRRFLDHFSALTDTRESWRVAYPLPEILLLAVCGSIASCDDYDDISESGQAHLAFLRYHHGLPCADGMRVIASTRARSPDAGFTSERPCRAHARVRFASGSR